MQKINEFDYFFADGEKVFFTSDTHFNHKAIIEYCNRPFSSVEEMNEKLIENWNAKVPKDGIVFHLGDFFFGGSGVFHELIGRLNGKIYLCAGNHDRHNWKTGFNNFIEDISYQYFIKVESDKILLTHFPLLCFPHAYGNYETPYWNLFGHVHSGPFSSGEDNKRLYYLFPTQYDVGVDNNVFTPISYFEVKSIIEQQKGKQNK